MSHDQTLAKINHVRLNEWSEVKRHSNLIIRLIITYYSHQPTTHMNPDVKPQWLWRTHTQLFFENCKCWGGSTWLKLSFFLSLLSLLPPSATDERAPLDCPQKILFVVVVPPCEWSLSESSLSIRDVQKSPLQCAIGGRRRFKRGKEEKEPKRNRQQWRKGCGRRERKEEVRKKLWARLGPLGIPSSKRSLLALRWSEQRGRENRLAPDPGVI